MKYFTKDFQFAYLLFFLFSSLAVYSLACGKIFLCIVFSLLFFLVFLSFFNSTIKNIINRVHSMWMSFGIFLGRVFSPLILGSLFFIFFTPISFVSRKFFGLEIKLIKNGSEKSYWVTYPKKSFTKSWFKNQF